MPERYVFPNDLPIMICDFACGLGHSLLSHANVRIGVGHNTQHRFNLLHELLHEDGPTLWASERHKETAIADLKSDQTLKDHMRQRLIEYVKSTPVTQKYRPPKATPIYN